MLDSINHEQGVYVLKCGNGYTCLGFDVADQRIQAMAEWLEGRTAYAEDMTPKSAERGTIQHYAHYTTMLQSCSAKATADKTRCPAELTRQLVGLEGKRVEVTDRHGERRRFIVGRSMGWMPVHLEIKTRRSMGGGAATGAPYQRITVLG